MELRPIQAALFAGRYASRRATTAPSPLSYQSIPSFYRCLSSTRPSLSEAEATAPAPPPSMQEWHQQQQQQPEQPQTRTWGTAAGNNSTNMPSGGIASLLRPNQSSTSSPPSPTPAPTPADVRNPWAKPSSPGLRRAQANRKASDAGVPHILDTLNDLGISTPSTDDLTMYPGMMQEPASQIKYRLRPSVGRTIHLDGGVGGKVDLARGLSLLNTRVRTNKIAQDLAKQRFHERPGLKRKRLRSERWRARFKDGFKASCSRVKELARQGW